jgi:pimeloyl-ACP methyl ester carboxylesterase
VINWADLSLFAPRSRAGHYVIAPDSSRAEKRPLHVLFQAGEGDTLIVVLHGAIDRGKYTLPRFEWLGTLKSRREHVLYVADPTLELASDLQIGWYVGTAEVDETARLVRLVEALRTDLGVARVLFMGGSAGGFASLMASARVAGSRALAFNPQITISEYYPRFVNRLMQVSLPEFASFDEARASLPSRLSVLDVIPTTGKMTNRALIVQNSGDSFHMENHLGHLAAQLEMPVARSVSPDNRMEFDVRYYGEGHSMPYRHVLTKYLDLTMERWSDERIIDSDDMFEDVEGLPVEPADASIDAPETT